MLQPVPHVTYVPSVHYESVNLSLPRVSSDLLGIVSLLLITISLTCHHRKILNHPVIRLKVWVNHRHRHEERKVVVNREGGRVRRSNVKDDGGRQVRVWLDRVHRKDDHSNRRYASTYRIERRVMAMPVVAASPPVVFVLVSAMVVRRMI